MAGACSECLRKRERRGRVAVVASAQRDGARQTRLDGVLWEVACKARRDGGGQNILPTSIAVVAEVCLSAHCVGEDHHWGRGNVVVRKGCIGRANGDRCFGGGCSRTVGQGRLHSCWPVVQGSAEQAAGSSCGPLPYGSTFVAGEEQPRGSDAPHTSHTARTIATGGTLVDSVHTLAEWPCQQCHPSFAGCGAKADIKPTRSGEPCLSLGTR
mmetsp:Transcript_69216/g.165969  ORF Transcript_69216/g.165969 Transcript_69216/m.165969 type:complete len:212 (+) Transcript_69216:295-930(+)